MDNMHLRIVPLPLLGLGSEPTLGRGLIMGNTKKLKKLRAEGTKTSPPQKMFRFII